MTTTPDPIAAIERGPNAVVELKPCPFCGGAAKMRKGAPDGFFVTCSVGGWECGVELHTYRGRLEVDAAGLWNRRAAPAGEDAWQPIETAPKDGSKFDAWCVNPTYPDAAGIRLTNVQMRGDNSGFGFVSYLREGVHWQYLDARGADSILPAWTPTHWRPLPAPPALSRKGSDAQTVGGGMAAEAHAPEALVMAPADILEAAAEAVNALLNIDDSSEYQQGVIDAGEVILALKYHGGTGR